MPSKSDPARAPASEEPAAVADYLRRHPDFLNRNPGLFDELAPPARKLGDNVRDWQAHLIARLREEAAAVRGERDELVSRARRERSLEDRVHAAALAMIGAADLDRLVEIATSDLAILLGVDAVAVAVEAACPDGRARVTRGVHCVVRGAVDRLMDDDRDVLLRSPARADESLFEGAASLVRSEALARFGGRDGLPAGLLALGSRHGARFRPGDPVGLYRFLANVLDRCLRGKLELPP